MSQEPAKFKIPDIFIDRNGDWFSDGAKVIHEKIFELFNESLRKDDSGAYYIRIGQQTCPVRVESTPYVVRGAFYENDAQGRDVIWLTLNHGLRAPLDPETLHAPAENELRCRVLDGVFDAAFSASAMSQLAPYIERDQDSGRCFIELNNQKYYF